LDIRDNPSEDRDYEAPEVRELGSAQDLTGLDTGGSQLDGTATGPNV
jgi:hypothetical protein